MFTQPEKDFLLKLLNSAQIGGTRQAIQKTMEMMDSIERKVKALPVVKPAEPKPDKKKK